MSGRERVAGWLMRLCERLVPLPPGAHDIGHVGLPWKMWPRSWDLLSHGLDPLPERMEAKRRHCRYDHHVTYPQRFFGRLLESALMDARQANPSMSETRLVGSLGFRYERFRSWMLGFAHPNSEQIVERLSESLEIDLRTLKAAKVLDSFDRIRRAVGIEDPRQAYRALSSARDVSQRLCVDLATVELLCLHLDSCFKKEGERGYDFLPIDEEDDDAPSSGEPGPETPTPSAAELEVITGIGEDGATGSTLIPFPGKDDEHPAA